MRPTIALALVLSWTALPASAQRGELTPEVALALLVEVQSTKMNSTGEPEPPVPAAGTVVGLRNDSLFVVTAGHHVGTAQMVQVRLTPTGPLLPAVVRALDSERDFAVLAVLDRELDTAWTVPTWVPRSLGSISPRESVLAIGCPDGKCWVPPEHGVVHDVSDSTVKVRTLYVRSGNSGGPLVDKHGALIGIVISHYVAEATAVRWDVVEAALQRWGYPVNLPEERGYRVGELSLRVFGAAYPPPGLNVDGGRLFPEWRIEGAYRVAPGLELVLGQNHVSYASTPPDDVSDSDDKETYTSRFLFTGVRLSHPMTGWSVSRAVPDVASFGVDLLIPFSSASYAVRMAPTDSVDLARGEYVVQRTEVDVPVGLSLALRGSYRVALTRNLGVLVSPSAYVMNFHDNRTKPFSALLEIGADLRLGTDQT